MCSLKSDVDKLDADKLKALPTKLNNLESKVYKINIDKLKTVQLTLKNLLILEKEYSLNN